MNTPEERKKKMLLFLPLLLLPFLALAFYALGGGKGGTAKDSQQTAAGINTSLPGAKLLHEKMQDKMSLYNQAAQDSAAARSHTAGNAFAALGWDTAGIGKKSLSVNSTQASEAKINQKLAEINRQMTAPEPVKSYGNSYPAALSPASPDMDRLEKLLKEKQQSATPDPEMAQLNTMLDKIMQIQNPTAAKEKEKTDTPRIKDSAFKAIPAIIDGNQKVVPGGVVKLRLQDTLHIRGLDVPKGSLLFGACVVTNQRLLLDIKNIRLGTSIIPVSLTVFSLDGMAGINAPEAELGQAAGNGTDNALQSMEFMPMDQSLTTQAASAGITAAKGLIGKKVKRIKVKLKGGEKVLLRINH